MSRIGRVIVSSGSGVASKWTSLNLSGGRGCSLLAKVKRIKSTGSNRGFHISLTRHSLTNEAAVAAACSEALSNETSNPATNTAVNTLADGVLDNPALLEKLTSVSSTLVEPPFHTLGLAHAWPSGWVQAIMEVIHVHGGLTWCATIMTSTILLRLMVFPLIIQQRQNIAKQNNIAPELQRCQADLQAAIANKADQVEVQRLQSEMFDLCDRHGVNMFFPFKVMAINGVLFGSMFFGIRGMANAPVESMKFGGLGWFTDLTVSDPIMLLPVLTATTFYLNIAMNAEGVDVNSMPPFMMKVLKLMPLFMVPAMVQFPAALNVYWLTHNLITVTQAQILKHKSVRDRLGIPDQIQWKDEDLPMKTDFFGAMSGKNASNNLLDRIKKEQDKEDAERKKSQTEK